MIYLDNAASAYVEEETCDFLKSQAMTFFANQEAVHGLAYSTRKALEDAEAVVCNTLADNDAALFWFASGTAAIWNLLNCPAFSVDGNIVTTELEHPAVANALAGSRSEIRHCSVLANGLIDREAFRSCLDSKTILVVCHLIQGEVGVTQDLSELRAIMKEMAPQALLIADAVQAVGKLRIPWLAAALDGLVFSGHKFGVPGGAGVIVRKAKEVALCDYLLSLRKDHYRVGRIDPAIAMTCAHQLVALYSNIDEHSQKIRELRNILISGLQQIKLPNGTRVQILIDNETASPFMVAFIVPGYQAAVLVRMLSHKKIYISAGSACQAETRTPSKALLALGITKEMAFSGLRCSFWLQNSKQDVDHFIQVFTEVLADY